jgi:hypothetical protein
VSYMYFCRGNPRSKTEGRFESNTAIEREPLRTALAEFEEYACELLKKAPRAPNVTENPLILSRNGVLFSKTAKRRSVRRMQ